jgi:hypothetical protein
MHILSIISKNYFPRHCIHGYLWFQEKSTYHSRRFSTHHAWWFSNSLEMIDFTNDNEDIYPDNWDPGPVVHHWSLTRSWWTTHTEFATSSESGWLVFSPVVGGSVVDRGSDVEDSDGGVDAFKRVCWVQLNWDKGKRLLQFTISIRFWDFKDLTDLCWECAE